MSDPTKIHVHTSTDGPCGYCSGDDCPMRYCPGCPPGCPLAEDEPDEDHDHHSDVRSVSPARDAVSDAEAAQWAALADAATEGPWVVDSDGSIGAPMAGLVCGEAGHPRLDCSECGTRVCHVNVMPGEPDAAFIAAARTAVPRLLVEREALRAYAGPGPYEPSEADGATWQELRERDALRATVRLMLGDAAAEGRCGCVALCEGPQEDCPLHGRDYAWWVGLAGTACADREWRLMAENARMRQVAELRVGTWRDTAARLEGERDRARGTAATLEAENARLREGIEAPAVEWEARVEPCSDRVRHMLDDHANALYALLDEGGE